ncbi:hypothetical protein Tco_1240969 [Tanacetum coccineum]
MRRDACKNQQDDGVSNYTNLRSTKHDHEPVSAPRATAMIIDGTRVEKSETRDDNHEGGCHVPGLKDAPDPVGSVDL